MDLTLAQRAQLQAAADSLSPTIAAVIDSLSTVLSVSGPMTAARTTRIQQQSERGRALFDTALRRTREVLTPVQWTRLPAWLTRPINLDRLERPTYQMQVPLSVP